MKYVLFVVILGAAYILGSVGFCQIVGTLKYFTSFSTGKALFAIVFWLIILGFAAFAVIKWLNNYSTALYIGYGISFLLSLRTKPDNQ